MTHAVYSLPKTVFLPRKEIIFWAISAEGGICKNAACVSDFIFIQVDYNVVYSSSKSYLTNVKYILLHSVKFLFAILVSYLILNFSFYLLIHLFIVDIE